MILLLAFLGFKKSDKTGGKFNSIEKILLKTKSKYQHFNILKLANIDLY